MRIIATVLAGVVLISACSKKSDDDTTDPVTVVNGKYLISQEQHHPNPHIVGVANFEYNGTNISRRTGYYSTASGSSITIIWVTGPTVITPDNPLPAVNAYDEVEYVNSNLVKITTKSTVDTLPGIGITEIVLDNGRLSKKFTHGYNNQPGDTIYYNYNWQGHLQSTVQTLGNITLTRNYTFDVNSNLTEVDGTAVDNTTHQTAYVTVEQFSGYDDKKNPLKGYGYWADLFYRSLSENNFSKYSYSYQTATQAEGTTSSVELLYNGNAVDFSK